MNSTRTTLYSMLIALSILGMLLVGIVALRYSYNALCSIESAAGFLVLGAVAGSLWLYRRRISQRDHPSEKNSLLLLGMALGLLWVIEISINNLIAPPLPARDIIDNSFWAVIAASILVASIIHAYKNNRLLRGIEVGTWCGFVSGLLACCMGLIVIVFGMHFILRDPLNIAEWAGRGASKPAPSMAAYFAFETLAGAFGHLLILGVVMGGLLGVIGGSVGKGVKRIVSFKRGN